MAGEFIRPVIGTHWGVLSLVCSMMWGVYFIYSLPASLSVPLSDHLALSTSQYAYLVSALYTIYAVPNIVLPVFSGPLVQRYGAQTVLTMTATSVAVGQLLFAWGVQIRSQLGMLLGRVFIGLGAEVIGVLGSEIITRWFKDRQISLALALSLAVSRLGSATTSVIIPRLIEDRGVISATWVGSLLSTAAVVISAATLLAIVNAVPPRAPVSATTHVTSLRRLSRIYWHLSLICILGYGGINSFNNSAQRFLASCFYDGDERPAGLAASIPYTLSGLFAPLFGFVLDLPWFGNSPCALVATNVLLATAHVLFLSRGPPILPLALFGIAFALFGVAFWVTLAESLLFATKKPLASQGHLNDDGVERGATPTHGDQSISSSTGCRQEGYQTTDAVSKSDQTEENELVTLGFGIMTSILNLSTGVIPLLLAKVEDVESFDGVELAFLVLAGLGCALCAQLAWVWRMRYT